MTHEHSPGTPSQKLPRGMRRKLETRAKLIEAARRVMGRKGVEAATIAEIAEAADVGFGSFYNHFASKEDIAAAVVQVEAESFGRDLDDFTSALSDPALIVTISILRTMRRVREDQVWGWFLVRAVWFVPELRTTLGRRMGRDVARGIESGRFRVPHDAMATELVGSLVMSAIRIGLEGRAPANGDDVLIELVLRTLGFTVEQAAAFSLELPAAMRSLEAASGDKEAAATAGREALARPAVEQAAVQVDQPTSWA